MPVPGMSSGFLNCSASAVASPKRNGDWEGGVKAKGATALLEVVTGAVFSVVVLGVLSSMPNKDLLATGLV